MRRALTALVIGAGTLAPTTADAAPGPLDDVRRAKIGLAGFLLDHVDRPLRVDDPCPSLSVEAVASHVTALGLVPSTREYGPAVVFDSDIGDGLAALRCGVDLSRSADPQGSLSMSTDVTMLDGQATFDQYAVDLGGTDVIVTDVLVDGVVVSNVDGALGRQAARCTNGGRDCTAALDVDGLVVTVRLRGLPSDTGDQLARQLVVAITPDIVANLAGLAAAIGDA